MVTVYTGKFRMDAEEVDPAELARLFWLLSPLATDVLDGNRKLSHAMNEYLVSDCGFGFDGDASDAFLAAFEAARPVLSPPPEPPAQEPPKKRRSRKVKA